LKFNVRRTGATAVAVALFVFLTTPPARAQAPDSLILKSPDGVKAWSVYNPQSRAFVIWVTWKDAPNNVAAFISPADTTGWSVVTPVAQLTYPTVTGAYTGDIDRTVSFHATRSGVVGTDSLIINYEIRREEYYSGRLPLSTRYVPGTVLPLLFRDQRNNQIVDFGLQISFSAGRIDALGSFLVGLEDFEGFHIWRGVRRDGTDLQVIGELSKEEAFKGRKTGGSLPDSLYFYDVVPTLRTSAAWFAPPDVSLDCLGTRVDLDLDPDQFFWFDCNGTNGFTYYYAVTTFDRGYSLRSGTQGLTKFDSCPVAEGTPYPCKSELVSVPMEVDAQSDLYKVYVVPNPVRTGSSRLTTDNYHNFPDGVCRFVNVPEKCTIKIFTVAGDLVWMNDHVDGTGDVPWDTKNLEEQEVASGVYVYRIENGKDSVYGRIVVIR
jgi:hypothetical protein